MKLDRRSNVAMPSHWTRYSQLEPFRVDPTVIDGKIELSPVLDHFTARAPLGLGYCEETEAKASRHGLGKAPAVAMILTGTVLDTNLESWSHKPDSPRTPSKKMSLRRA
jgi:hypothetical protein